MALDPPDLDAPIDWPEDVERSALDTAVVAVAAILVWVLLGVVCYATWKLRG